MDRSYTSWRVAGPRLCKVGRGIDGCDMTHDGIIARPSIPNGQGKGKGKGTAREIRISSRGDHMGQFDEMLVLNLGCQEMPT